MITATLSQPESQLGAEFMTLLASNRPYRRIIFVSAFTALRTILRLREGMLAAADSGATVRLIVGIDLGGTSREVLEELSRWNCEVFVYHNPIVRSTFHPKIYLFESELDSTLYLGSNNLTDGGLYTNYEASTRHIFSFPSDANEYERLLRPIKSFLEPKGPTVRLLDTALIETLSARGALTTETEARRSRRDKAAKAPANGSIPPPNPFLPITVPLPPLLPKAIRDEFPTEHPTETPRVVELAPIKHSQSKGALVWRKVLSATDAQKVGSGTHHVGGVRLTQARFENPTGNIIDQTTYFRRLFDDYIWEAEPGGYADQEKTYVPMGIIIEGNDYGIRNFEISHKPSGEAGQGNFTTTLRWGRDFMHEIEKTDLTGMVFSLYENPTSDAPFLIEIMKKVTK